MVNQKQLFLLGSLSLFIAIPYSFITGPSSSSSNRLLYIVHVREPDEGVIEEGRLEAFHGSFLPPAAQLIYSYKHAISGFAARLTPDEAKAMEAKDGFLLAHTSRRLQHHTTYSPYFLRLDESGGLWKSTDYGKKKIIAVMDHGVFPNHASFDDDGMPPRPDPWKKKPCGFEPTTLCNNKLIGAACFDGGKPCSPLDIYGHGTNTAAIAAGIFVKGASVNDLAKLNPASGAAPLAHLAVYKVCSKDVSTETIKCEEADILKGLDQAIEDGVDVISISLGGPIIPLYKDSIAIGTLQAVKRGIFVSTSAGNNGPGSSTVENVVPWVLTVGASTIDRTLIATVKLGNEKGELLDGQSANQKTSLPQTLLPLVYPGSGHKPIAVKQCDPGSLDGFDVKGKVVICQGWGEKTPAVEKGRVVEEAGGSAMVLLNPESWGFTTDADNHVLPASQLNYADSVKIQNYVKESDPKATIIFGGTDYGIPPSPTVGAFSARGPAKKNGEILKPDIIGPGVNILTATPPKDTPLGRAQSFDIVSGTSMATPHLSGIAAMLKANHEDHWSPAAIKSAIMTSSDILNREQKPISDETQNPAANFAMGAGHVNPTKADQPGLVYDLNFDDYVSYLCGLGYYTDKQVSDITRSKVVCSELKEIISPENLNYPSITFSMGRQKVKNVRRTVKNVGEPGQEYSVDFTPIVGVKMMASPSSLKFEKTGDVMTFEVHFSTKGTGAKKGPVFGQMAWSDSSHKYVVRSPITVTIT